MNKNVFQYAVLTYRHDLFTKEFLNIGLVAYCVETKEFVCKMSDKYGRITNTFPGANGDFILQYMHQLQTKMDHLQKEIASNQLSWTNEFPKNLDKLLTSVLPYDDSPIYFSTIYKTAYDDFNNTFEKLFNRLVGYYHKSTERDSRNDHEVWESYQKTFK